MESGIDLHDRPADRQHPGREVQVTHPQLGQLTPAQAALHRSLHQQLGLRIGQALAHGSELLRRDDRARLSRDRRGPDALARVQERHLVVERRGEDRAQHDEAGPDRRRLNSPGLQAGDPLPHMLGQDVDHPHRPELRQDAPAQDVGVRLAGGRLDLVVGQPGLLDIVPERLPAPARLPQLPLRDPRLRPLPRAVGLPLRGEGPSRPLAALQVTVERRITDAPIRPGTLPRRSHGNLLPRSFVSRLSTSPPDILRHTPVASNLD